MTTRNDSDVVDSVETTSEETSEKQTRQTRGYIIVNNLGDGTFEQVTDTEFHREPMMDLEGNIMLDKNGNPRSISGKVAAQNWLSANPNLIIPDKTQIHRIASTVDARPPKRVVRETIVTFS